VGCLLKGCLENIAVGQIFYFVDQEDFLVEFGLKFLEMLALNGLVMNESLLDVPNYKH
jgi:hypothetical protein